MIFFCINTSVCIGSNTNVHVAIQILVGSDKLNCYHDMLFSHTNVWAAIEMYIHAYTTVFGSEKLSICHDV
jgi:hypothetical protein